MTNLPLGSGTLWKQPIVIFVLFSFGSEYNDKYEKTWVQASETCLNLFSNLKQS